MTKKIRFKDFSQEELRKLQLKLTDILNEFDRFCNEHGLTYFLSAGTCLGAVRHKGFIPWDDDLDVCMPRKDYEKLAELWNPCHPDGKYVLCRPGKNVLTGVHITTIKDSTTTCVYEYSAKYDICQGVKIDVEVLDGVPESKIGQLAQLFFANLYGLFAAQRVPNQQPGWKKVVARMTLPVFRYKNFCYRVFSVAENQVKKYDLDKCDKVLVNFGGAGGKAHPKDLFFPVSYLEFEGQLRPVPHQYDNFLKLIYGNYMEFPPENERYPRTEVLAFDLERGYGEPSGQEPSSV